MYCGPMINETEIGEHSGKKKLNSHIFIGMSFGYEPFFSVEGNGNQCKGNLK